jgi:hypothetical protein
MINNEEIVRELCAAAERSGKDIAKLVSFFSAAPVLQASSGGGPVSSILRTSLRTHSMKSTAP